VKKLRIYVDTSVLGGCFDHEFAQWSNRLMEEFRRERLLPVLSDVTAAEVLAAPHEVRVLHEDILVLAREILPVTEEVLSLAGVYQARGVLPPRFHNDMLHIALATVAEVDVLVSWNFRHIVRLDKIRVFNGVNLEMGYKALMIYSPREVVSDESE